MKFKFTQAKIESLPAPAKGQDFHWDTEERCFGVCVYASGKRSYIVQARVRGRARERRVTIAPCDNLPLKEARNEAARLRAEMYKGIDPQAERKQQAAQGVTLREVMEDYLINKRTKHGPLRPATKSDIRKSVEKLFAKWADEPVARITTEACRKRFRELSKIGKAQTNGAFRNLRALLNWARETNATDDGNYPILPINPVSQMFRSEHWHEEKPRTTRIPSDKIGAAWLMLEQYRDPERNIAVVCTSADLITCMLLTGMRIGECSKLRWQDVHLFDDLPTFHLAVTKNHRPITFPVGTVLKELFTARYAARVKGNDYVFPAVAGKSGHIRDPRGMLDRVSEAAGLHLANHDMRRTFDDVGQLCEVDSDKRRQLLNHVGKDVHGVSYANNPDPKALLPALEKIGNWYVEQARIAKAVAEGENVLPMRA